MIERFYPCWVSYRIERNKMCVSVRVDNGMQRWALMAEAASRHNGRITWLSTVFDDRRVGNIRR